MRQALHATNRQSVASSKSYPSPVGGWNAKDSLANMKQDEAVILNNWFPESSYVRSRGGTNQFADTGEAGFPVDSLMRYNGLTYENLFAAVNNSIYDVTAGGTIGAPDITGLTNSRWQHTNFGNTAGNWLAIVNGDDAPRIYNGTVWAAMTLSGSGLTVSDLIHVNNYENRLWFVEKDTLSAWYLPINAISGTLVKFDLSGVASRGGYLMAIATWSRDSGSGPDDYIVFITSQGDILLYQGVDPNDATTFKLHSIYYMGEPIGRRCYFRVGAELVLMTQNGFVQLSKLINFGNTSTGVTITDKIKDAVSVATTQYRGHFGWQAIAYPSANMGIFNIPVSEATEQEQYVVNTQTGAWCKFTDISANCFSEFYDGMYYGDNNGTIRQMETGTFDDVNGSQNAINTEALTAYSYFGARGRLKHWTLVRPVMRSTGILTVAARISVDFQYTPPESLYGDEGDAGGAWDVSPWDTSAWADTYRVSKKRKGVKGLGYAAALGVKTITKYQNVQWLSTDYLFELGGFI